MNPPSIMVVAGETSGDQLASELISELQSQIPQHFPTLSSPIHWFGAGGPKMRAAGVELLADMTQWSTIGITDVARRYTALRSVFKNLIQTAENKRPALVILVDYSHFNHKLARTLKKRLGSGPHAPFIVKFVCPQVWASRPKRAATFHQELNLLLCLFSFEKQWLAQRAPQLPVEWVGHPLLNRYPAQILAQAAQPKLTHQFTLLPGSREQELRRHLPILRDALEIVRKSFPAKAVLVLPHERLVPLCREWIGSPDHLEVRVGQLAETLASTTIAFASTGSVTLECALFQVPTIALYRTSWLTYQIGKRVVTIPYLAMPNILAHSPLFPEFIQNDATPEAIAHAALHWLQNPGELQKTRTALQSVVSQLGQPGATRRAASAILHHWSPPHSWFPSPNPESTVP